MDIIVKNHTEYQCYAVGNQYKFENWAGIKVARPEPQATNYLENFESLISETDLYYNNVSGKGKWVYNQPVTDTWQMHYRNLSFKLQPTSFKQLGLFPEQATNWDFVAKKIKRSQRDDIRVLNLFAYTGAATISAAQAGAKEVVHIDSLKSANEWAKENSVLSNTEHCTIRYIQEDALKFMQRELKRGNKYQVIIMDPPSFGRGPKGEVWKFEENLEQLLTLASQLLEDPLCLVISTYTTGFTKHDLNKTLKKYFKNGEITTGNLFLPVTNFSELQCGVYGRYELS